MSNDSETGLRTRKKNRNRTTILEAARSLFRSKGFGPTRMDEIARDARVAVGTCYNYFDHKTDLLLAMVVEADLICVAEAQGLMEALPSDPIEALCAVAFHDSRHSMAAIEKAEWRLVIGAVLADPDTAFARAYEETTAQLADLVVAALRILQARGTVRANVDPVEAGQAIHAMKYMLFIEHVASPDETFDEHCRRVGNAIAVVVNGLTAADRNGPQAR